METIRDRTNEVITSLRAGLPRPVKITLCRNHDCMTFSGECSCTNGREKTLYAVIGTDYGFLHTSAGDVHTWTAPGGAYRAARAYKIARGML